MDQKNQQSQGYDVKYEIQAPVPINTGVVPIQQVVYPSTDGLINQQVIMPQQINPQITNQVVNPKQQLSTPLLTTQTPSEPLGDVPVKKKNNSCGKCCFWSCGLCCFLCVCCCCLCVGSLIIYGVVHAILVTMCLNYSEVGETTIALNDTNVFLTFENYGNFEVIESLEYKIHVKYFKKGEVQSFNVEEVDNEHIKITGPGYTYMGIICQGYDVTLFKPKSKMIYVDLLNRYGSVSFNNTKLDGLKIAKSYGRMDIVDITAKYADFGSSYTYQKFSRVAVEDLKVVSKYGSSKFSEVSAIRADFDFDYHYTTLDDWNSVNTTVRLSHSGMNVKCQYGKMKNVDLQLKYSGFEMDKCTMFPNSRIKVGKASYSSLNLQNLFNDSQIINQMNQLEIEYASYSDFNLHENVKYFSVKADTLKYSDIRYYLTPADFLPFAYNFDMEGHYSHWKVSSYVDDYVDYTLDTHFHKTGTVNKEGIDIGGIFSAKGSYSSFKVSIEEEL